MGSNYSPYYNIIVRTEFRACIGLYPTQYKNNNYYSASNVRVDRSRYNIEILCENNLDEHNECKISSQEKCINGNVPNTFQLRCQMAYLLHGVQCACVDLLAKTLFFFHEFS